jgi:hypothetical protein
MMTILLLFLGTVAGVMLAYASGGIIQTQQDIPRFEGQIAGDVTFIPEVLQLIVDGVKTQTRRPVKQDKGPELVVGQSYGIQGTPLVIRITGIRKESVCRISHADIKAEGYDEFASFKEVWERIYSGTEWSIQYNPMVWVYKFEVVI